MTAWINRTRIGDCRVLMREMLADGQKVNCIVTSPPYWGLRDYGVKGQFGLERNWIRHVARMRYVFRLARQLLAKDGTLWLNYGDSYASGGGDPYSGFNSRWHGTHRRGKQDDVSGAYPNKRRTGMRPKNLVGMPWRVALALQDDGWYLRSEIIWHKPNAMPESCRDRPTKAHEHIFLFAKSRRYHYDVDAIAEPTTGNAHPRGEGVNPKARRPSAWDESNGSHRELIGRYPRNRQNESFSAAISGPVERVSSAQVDIFGDAPAAAAPVISTDRKALRTDTEERHRSSVPGGQDLRAEPIDTRNVRTVWSINTEAYEGAHFATFPTELVARCILAGTRPGGIVLDPFMGSGTVGQVASDLGRKYIGLELNPNYVALHDKRRTTLGMPL